MIDTKNFKVRTVDNVDGSVTVEVGILVRATHKIPAKQVLEAMTSATSRTDKLVYLKRKCEQPLRAAVVNHIYGDLVKQVAQLKTLAKLTAGKKHQLETYRVCTEIDRLLNLKV